ncbi:MAG: 4-hydroxy-tetrahydrodipicolinate reductase [Puniceicoccaceae bacterium]|nr:MAG: 4-hydroxy-tetrahydrodipicolinate reductase [Puniceicoccaceae bacterium]
MSVKIVINGAAGRMGRAVAAAAAESGAEIVGQVDLGRELASVADKAEVIVDFSSHEATRSVLETAVAARKPVVIGTTGHAPALKASLIELAAPLPVVWTGNFSVGVNLLFYLVERAARVLPPAYQAEITDLHHQFKKDAPSGTAEQLVDIIRTARSLPQEAVRPGRHGIVGERPNEEIGVHALRGGDVVGEHTVLFAGPGERLELTHRAGDRSIFARGALRAALWVADRPPGLYSMQDVLGLKD